MLVLSGLPLICKKSARLYFCWLLAHKRPSSEASMKWSLWRSLRVWAWNLRLKKKAYWMMEEPKCCYEASNKCPSHWGTVCCQRRRVEKKRLPTCTKVWKRLWTRQQKSQKREKVHQTKKGRRKERLDVLWPGRFRGGATHKEPWGTWNTQRKK